MDKERETDIVDIAVKHRKTCETCTKSHVCDEMAEINAKLLEKALFG